MRTGALKALWVGVGLVVLTGFWPPWVFYNWRVGDSPNPTPTYAGRSFLFHPPQAVLTGEGFIDLSRLLVEWGVIGSITLALVATLNRASA